MLTMALALTSNLSGTDTGPKRRGTIFSRAYIMGQSDETKSCLLQLRLLVGLLRFAQTKFDTDSVEFTEMEHAVHDALHLCTIIKTLEHNGRADYPAD